MISVLRTALVALGLVVSIQATAAQQQDNDTHEIERVMQVFHQAVAGHDGATLESMFLPGAHLVNVLDDERFAAAKAKAADAEQVKIGAAHDFAQFVSTSKASLNPVHSNVRVTTDGWVATVYFDFVFNIDGKPQNAGSETWQLVHGGKDWKIASISYSSHLPGHEDAPR